MKLRKYSSAITAFFALMIFTDATRASENQFRTPAKRYGSAYSVKLTLHRGEFDYVIPVWVRPDEKESSLDPGQLALMGWKDNNFVADEVEMSGETIPITRFGSAHSDFALIPDYPKNCCMGTLGYDVIQHYSIHFDPRRPVPFLVWTKLPPAEKPVKVLPSFSRELSSLFSLHSEIVKWKGKAIDMGESPYDLNVRENKLTMLNPETPEEHTRKHVLFSFEFLPITRFLNVKNINRKTKKVSPTEFKKGLIVTDLDGSLVTLLDRIEIEDYLKGVKGSTLAIRFVKTPDDEQKWDIYYNFEKDEFTQAKPVPSPARRH